MAELIQTVPLDSEKVGLGASRIRETRESLIERLAVDHHFVDDDELEDNIGAHKQVGLIEKADHLAAPTAGIVVYDKSGALYLRKKTGDPVAIIDETNQTITGVKTFASFPVTPSSAPTTDYQMANKKYADDAAALAAAAVSPDQLLIVVDQKAAGTNGGTFTSGAWRTRDLNNERYNNISGASLASNQITLPAGTYKIRVDAPAGSFVDTHQAIIYDVTNDAILRSGSCGRNRGGGSSDRSSDMSNSVIVDVITLAAETILEIRHRCQSTVATYGFGHAGNFAVYETYTQVEIQKIG